MSVGGTLIGIWVFLVADIVFHIFIVRYLMKIDVICTTMKKEYLSIVKDEIAQTNTCFKEWQSCIERWQESVDITNEVIAILKEVTQYDQTRSAKETL